MIYEKAEIRDNQVITTYSREIDQGKLTSDCWLIQFEGLRACKTCKIRGTKDCGGGKTLKRMQKEVS